MFTLLISLENNTEIKIYLKCNKSQKFIAGQLGVSESTISRELKRGVYPLQNAQEHANIRKERFAVKLWAIVKNKISIW
ncbi:hypothetical protein CGC59_00675 [Capnocytophaga sputigena]|uniref:Uncharacterized protein n=1 Tax=Capnocytophaga sputigena TaxID=1019 RepID=A0A2A3N5Q5_CAPSP|nr:hypothetical protein CGC59_00675 [Capnocytophaga sputigena]PBN46948.1 hypothetical protein CDC50_13310 [Capnocytophaga sputigena]